MYCVFFFACFVFVLWVIKLGPVNCLKFGCDFLQTKTIGIDKGGNVREGREAG